MTQPLTPPVIDWEEPPIPPEDLIFDDGEPLETHRHRKAMNVLITLPNCPSKADTKV
ncbi:hypothetical protein [Microcystis sp. LSC13-02]|jgi:hypothetical protein|uniref:hypothetical protein n=1 Tax=Microcystis sp. LSC13-02 TaxID=1895004 RepID=UPI00257C6E11|nr:hypothetical protein [Microcystis sp. LSC13-02]